MIVIPCVMPIIHICHFTPLIIIFYVNTFVKTTIIGETESVIEPGNFTLFLVSFFPSSYKKKCDRVLNRS